MPATPSRSVRSLPGKANWASFPYTHQDDIALPTPTRCVSSSLGRVLWAWLDAAGVQDAQSAQGSPAPPDPLASS